MAISYSMKTVCAWFVEFELITLVTSQESELLHWSQNWGFEGKSLLKEISKIAELTQV